MILDKELLLSENQSIAAAAGAAVISTDVVHIPQVKNFKGSAGNDRPNVSGKLFLNVIVTTALVAAVNGSVVTFELYNDTDDVPTTGGDVLFTKAVTANTTTAQPAGTVLFSVPLPGGQLKPYFGLKAGIATQALSSGNITAWLGNQIQQGT